MTQADKAIEKLDKKLELPGVFLCSFSDFFLNYGKFFKSNAAIQIKWADGEPERLGDFIINSLKY